MNTPPTMSTAPLPMAPVKFNRKLLSKLDIKPKKLMYNEQDVETVSNDTKTVSEELVESQEKLQLPEKSKRKDSIDSTFFSKHVEQNELDNEAEQTEVKHSYNLRRRNKNSICEPTKLMTKKKIGKKKFEDDKENVHIKTPTTSGVSVCRKLSQPAENLNKWEKLEWLQKRRDVGVWVKCCNKNCGKWRFVEAFHEPINVPEFWTCHMNPNEKFSSCEDPEDLNYTWYKKDLIENEYNAGSLVWGKVVGYPWWPGMVDDSPETLSYYELKGLSKIPVRYHVTFFEKKASRAWLTTRCIKPLKENDTTPPVKRARVVYRGINYKEQVKKSLKQAKSALPLTIRKRLEKFSFRTRFCKKNLTKLKTKTSSPFNPDSSLAIIRNFSNNILPGEHKKLSGRDLNEDIRLREEIIKNKEAKQERLYFALEYKNEGETSSQGSSAYGSEKSEYVFGSQPGRLECQNILLVPRIVLRTNKHIEDLL